MKYTISSHGHHCGICSGKNCIKGEGTAFIRFFPGSFSRYALFTNEQINERNQGIRFGTRTVFYGLVHTNGTFQFDDFPEFYGPVTSGGQMAIFYNNHRSRTLDADRKGDIDEPVFHECFRRGVKAETMPNTLAQLRQLNLAHQLSNPPTGVAYHFPLNPSGKIVGGL